MMEPSFIKRQGTVSQALEEAEDQGWSGDAVLVSKVMDDGKPVAWWIFNNDRHADFLVNMLERALELQKSRQ